MSPIKFGLILVGSVAVPLIGTLIVSKLHCESQWAQSGLAVQWGPLKGCVVQMPSGRWIPAERVRDIDLGTAK